MLPSVTLLPQIFREGCCCRGGIIPPGQPDVHVLRRVQGKHPDISLFEEDGDPVAHADSKPCPHHGVGVEIQVPDALREPVSDYLLLILLGLPASYLYNLCNAILRSINRTGIVLLILFASVLLTIFSSDRWDCPP